MCNSSDLKSKVKNNKPTNMVFIYFVFAVVGAPLVRGLPVNMSETSAVTISTPDNGATNLQLINEENSDVTEGVETLIDETMVNKKIYSDENEIKRQQDKPIQKTRTKRSLIADNQCPEGTVHVPPPINRCIDTKEFEEYFNPKDDYNLDY